ncbi:MAG: integrin alpha [Marinicella sp.]
MNNALLIILVFMTSQVSALTEVTSLEERGTKIDGIEFRDYVGASVTQIGDFNGDGFNDLAFGAHGRGWDQSFPGSTYIVFGGVDLPINLTIDEVSKYGVEINGFGVYGASGFSVSSAGDFNNDGFNDLLIGSPSEENPNTGLYAAGALYVIFGSSSPPSVISLTDLNGSNGLGIYGNQLQGGLGQTADSLGDINNDGFDDVIVSNDNYSVDTNSVGAVHVIYGSSGLSVNNNISDLVGSNNAFTIIGINDKDRIGQVEGANDLNNDGIPDFLFLARGQDDQNDIYDGKGYVVFGKGGGASFPQHFDITTLNGQNGFVINVGKNPDYTIIDLTEVGDLNDDGINDLAIGMNFKSSSGLSVNGEVQFIWGLGGNYPARIDLASIGPTQGFSIDGAANWDGLGLSIENGGDYNFDGKKDILLGYSSFDEIPGKLAVLFRDSDLWSLGSMNLGDLENSHGFVIVGEQANDYFGYTSADIGDFNGDQIDDLLVGAFALDGEAESTGGVYIITDVNNSIFKSSFE